jgi:hypothetical protein
MKVYLPRENKEHIETLLAFQEGSGAEIKGINDYEPSDVAIIFGIGKKGIPVSFPRAKVFNGQKATGGITIVIEKGYIRRDEYYAVGINGLNNRAYFNNLNSPGDRFKELGVELKSGTDGYTLLCGQVPHDASVQNVLIDDWYQKIIKSLDVVFRPHPLFHVEPPGVEVSQKSLEDDLEGAGRVITYNSNTGVDAALRGLPVYAEDKGSMVYDIASQDLQDIHLGDRTQWANNIAYSQWTPEEMARGLPWNHFYEYIERFRAKNSDYKLDRSSRPGERQGQRVHSSG